MRDLPSTAALRVFEAAARRLSFTEAAQDLNLTQGAISHQIRELEGRLGHKLFERRGRGLVLTEAGRTYLPFVRESLDRLVAGADALSMRRGGTVLTVSLSPNFAAKWLVPRLGTFLETHSDLDIRISASTHHIDFARDDFDMAIRHGDGIWPHLHVTRLCAEDLTPVCSPSVQRAGPPLRTPADLSGHVLIHGPDRAAWADWLQRVGAWDVDPRDGPTFDQTSLAIDAAVAGQGIALARTALAALDLRAGRLVRPLPEAVPAVFAYWIVCPRPAADRPKIARFRTWLLEQATADAAALDVYAEAQAAALAAPVGP